VAADHLSERQIEDIPMEIEAGRLLDLMLVLRLSRPGNWVPPVRLEGIEHREAALSEGQGAIMLAGDFSSGSIVNLFAMATAGHEVAFISSEYHGFIATRFGRRFLNWIKWRVEDRFGRRIVFNDDAGVAAGREMRRELAANQPLGVIAGAWIAKKIVEIPFLSGRMRLGTGVVNLALSTQATILPVVMFWEENGETYRFIIDRPLRPPWELDKAEAGIQIMSDFLDRLAPFILTQAGQWRGWRHMAGG
jgi:lauroyl/myristoyl acyltransferase